MSEHDDLRRRFFANGKVLLALADAAHETEEYRRHVEAKAAYEATPAYQKLTEAQGVDSELEEEAAGRDLTTFSCELCSCPLFSGETVDEVCRDPDSGVSVCWAAGYEDETKDCPGKRLGLIG